MHQVSYGPLDAQAPWRFHCSGVGIVGLPPVGWKIRSSPSQAVMRCGETEQLEALHEVDLILSMLGHGVPVYRVIRPSSIRHLTYMGGRPPPRPT